MTLARALAAATAALALAGCANTQWVRPDTAPQQAEQDAIDCNQAAWREARSWAWSYGSYGTMPFFDAMGRSAFAWPSGPFYGPFGDPYLEEGRLAQFCMRKKGYDLQEVPKKQP